MLHTGYQPSMGHRVAGQLVGDQHPQRVARPLEQLTKEPSGGLGVTAEGDQGTTTATPLWSTQDQATVRAQLPEDYQLRPKI